MIISQMLSFCYLGVILSVIAFVHGFTSLRKRDSETERYIARLESENRLLKDKVDRLERKVKGDRLVFTISLDNE